MKKLSVLFSLIFLLSSIVPAALAETDFMIFTRSDENLLTVSGNSGRGNVTVRSIYFGVDEPYFPEGADNYEISAEQVLSGEVNLNYFNVVSADMSGRYSVQFRLPGYGYYLINAVSQSGQRENRLYRYRASSEDMEPPISANVRNTDPSRIFEMGKDKFILMEMSAEKSVLLPYTDIGISNGYMIEEYLESAASKLPDEISEYVTDMYLMDSGFTEKFAGEFGIADGVGYFGDEEWRVLKNQTDNRDVSKYEQSSIEGSSDGILMENILFSKDGAAVLPTEEPGETVIEFTAPYNGEYIIDYAFSGRGSVKAQLTSLRNEKKFDNDMLFTVKYSGAGKSGNEIISLSEGDRIFLHLYPAMGDISLDYSISCGTEIFSLKDFASAKNMWWTSGKTDSAGFAFSMNDSDFGSVSQVSDESELFVRPVIEVDNRLFTSVKLNVKNAGGAVLSALREHFTREALAVYDEYELNTIFNEFGGFLFEVLPFTDGDGNEITQISDGVINAGIEVWNTADVSKKLAFMLGIYTGEGRLLKVSFSDINLNAGESGKFFVSAELEGVLPGAYAKTFIWNSAGRMKPVSETVPREPMISRLTEANGDNPGNWKMLVKPVGSTDYTQYREVLLTGNDSVNTGYDLPNVSWNYKNAENRAYIRPEKTGEQIIEYTVPHKGNWEVAITWRNIGVDATLGGDGGSLNLSYLPMDENNDSRIFRTLGVSVSHENPVSNSYRTVISADGGDKILLSANAGIDGYGDRWEIEYVVSETEEQGRTISEDYEKNLPDTDINGSASKATVKENTVWIGIDGSFGDSEAAKEKILYFKKFIPNMGVVLMSANPQDYCNQAFYEENDIPVIIQSYGAGFEEYISENNAWEWDWNNVPLDSSHWQDLSGGAHAFSMPHYATREIFSRLAKSAAGSGYSGYGYPDCVWMWGARGISGYNPETVEAFVEDLSGRDSGLKCSDGVWHFHDYYRYYTKSDTLIVPEDLGFSSWDDYTPLSQKKNAELINSGVDTTAHWAVFDMLCHYEWLKFVQYVGQVSHDNGGICQIMINPEYYPDGVDYLFLNKLVDVDMTEDEFFGNTDYLDGAYYRYNYLTKYAGAVDTGGVMEAGGGGNGGAYYTDEIAYLSAFELGALESIDHLETDFMYQNAGFSPERDGQIMSYAMGFSAAKSLGFKKKEADFVLVSSRNQSRPWAFDTEWKPWSLRIGYDGNIDFFLAKSGYNFDGISQEGIFDVENENVVVFSPHRVTESVWREFLSKLEEGSIGTGIISAHRFDTVVTDKLKTVSFSEIAPDYPYAGLTDIGLSGHITADGEILTSSRKGLEGGLYAPMSGDETILGFKTLTKTYPLAVKRSVGSGEMYILLFDDSLSENYEITEFVYDYLMELSGIKPMFKSLENSGSLVDGFTETPAHLKAIEADIGASARIYENGDMIAAGVQNSLARVNAESALTSTGQCAPYEISGLTSVKIMASPNETYKYLSVPSGTEGTATADAEGYVTLSFENTSHEIFFLLPENSTKTFDEIKNMQEQWKTALNFS